MKHFSSYIILLVCILFYTELHASHYRAGEITYAQISGRRYLVTATTYTDPTARADSFTGTLTIIWGDKKSDVVPRTNRTLVSPTVSRNTYVFEHEYQTEGVFIISITDPNRVDGILNINNGQSSNTPFYVESFIRISSTIGNNQSPILTVPPIVDGCNEFLYLHNPGAYDPDGDSLVYSLDVPKQATGEPVPNYETPKFTDSFAINSQTGTLTWAKPFKAGLYNIAIKVSEFRNGLLVGYVVRDMQILIRECINEIPVITKVNNNCVVAGDSVSSILTATDVNIQTVTIIGYGAPFKVPIKPAVLSPNNPGVSLATARFLWRTDCSHIRNAVYQATIEAKDNFLPSSGAGYTTFDIKVVGPAPKNITVKQIRNGFKISWSKDTCQLANRYKVYRRIDSSFWNHAVCETGIPASTGFKLIGEVKSGVFATTDTTFYDDNKGEGLSPLINYCYRIVAVFPPRTANGNILSGGISSESYASVEVCDAIIRSKPIITHVSVMTTDAVNGALKLSWLRPDTLDTAVYTAPYKLVFKRAVLNNSVTGSFTTFATANYATFSSISDSSLIDSNINTLVNQYIYKIELLYDSSGISTFADVSPLAASIYTKVYATDNTNILTIVEKVPWVNTAYTIFRKNNSTSLFDSITTTNLKTYADTGLINGVSYCYYVQSKGSYSFYLPVLYNNSQEICGTPIDTVRPCPPILSVVPPCDVFNDFTNKLSWIPRQQCADDVIGYAIYYKKLFTDSFSKIATVSGSVLNYSDSRDLLKFSIAGCYTVTGIDSFNNESFLNDSVCIDNCPFYQIPNVFTPNSDGKNDLLRPFPYRFIDHIKLRIYNRWGGLVYETENLDILWDGKTQDTKMDCSEGVYFYTCEIYEQYLMELKTNPKRGTIQLIRE